MEKIAIISELYSALTIGDVAVKQELLETEFEMNKLDMTGRTPHLHTFLQCGLNPVEYDI